MDRFILVGLSLLTLTSARAQEPEASSGAVPSVSGSSGESPAGFPSYDPSSPQAYIPTTPAPAPAPVLTPPAAQAPAATGGATLAAASSAPALQIAAVPSLVGIMPTRAEVGRPLTLRGSQFEENSRVWFSGLPIQPASVSADGTQLVIVVPPQLSEWIGPQGALARVQVEVGSKFTEALEVETFRSQHRLISPYEAWLGSLAILLTFILVGAYVGRGGRRHNRGTASFQTGQLLLSLVVEEGTGNLSLSRVQMALWAAVVSWSYMALVIGNAAALAAGGGLPDVGDGIPALLGLSLTTTVASGAISGSRPRSTRAKRPHWRDLVCVDDGPSLMRLQLLLWTAIAVGSYVVLFLARDPASLSLPDLPQNLLLLTGFSQGSYLADKFTTPNTNAAPVAAAPPDAPAGRQEEGG